MNAPTVSHQARSFTTTYDRISRVLVNKVAIASAFDPATATPVQQASYREYNAIWDTGATASVITQKIVDELLLKPIGLVEVHHTQGKSFAETYLVNIGLPNQVAFYGVTVTKGNFAGGDTLIGMDIINQGDFSVSNFNGKTGFSFRIPSMSTVDFTGKVPVTVPPKVGRNDLCPCGSGQKFKKCHGK